MPKSAPTIGANFVLLGFKQIEIDRMWQRNADTDASSPVAWKHFGGPWEVLQRCAGPSPLPVPVLDGDAANVKATSCFKDMKGIACAMPAEINKPRIADGCALADLCSV